MEATTAATTAPQAETVAEPVQEFEQPAQEFEQPVQEYAQPAQEYAQPIQEYIQPVELPDDIILDLAKRRLATKKSLMLQLFDFVLLVVYGIAMLFLSYDYVAQLVLTGVFFLFFGGRLLWRTLRFMRTSLRGGLAEYLKKRREQELENEYRRLKKLDAGSITEEFDR